MATQNVSEMNLDLDILEEMETVERPTVTIGGVTYRLKGEYDITVKQAIALEARLKALLNVDTDNSAAVEKWFVRLSDALGDLFIDDVSAVDWDALGIKRIARLIDFFVRALGKD